MFDLNNNPSISHKINQTSAAVIEQIANRVIDLDAEAHEQLKNFSDKVIHIQITDLKLDYYFLFPQGNIVVLQNSEREVSAVISGKLSAFINAMTAEKSGDVIFTGELYFLGEINTARAFQNFVESLEIDWQEPMSRIFGDMFTHNATKVAKSVGSFLKQFIDNSRQDIPEYLQHEIRVTPAQAEIDLFLQNVDQARSQVDRLQAKVERLLLRKSEKPNVTVKVKDS